MFWPLGREDFKESMADQMVLYSAVPYDKVPVSNDQPEQPKYAEADVLLVSFRNVNGVWLLDNFWQKANAQ